MSNRTLAVAALALAAVASQAPPARADIDCKVILCLAGGFPSGCADAYRYMIDRITDLPPKPPFGICSMSNGRPYTAHRSSARRLFGSESYVCTGDRRLRYRRWRDEDGSDREEAFCYVGTRQRRVYDVREDRWRTIVEYVGRRGARRVDYALQVTIEPGTPSEFRSPTYRVNTRTGFVHPRP